jgi:hypothetical protein
MDPPVIPRKRSTPSASLKESGTSGISFREGKNPATRSPRYVETLASAGIFMKRPEIQLRIEDTCKALCQKLLDDEQLIPKDSLFEDERFHTTCESIQDRNEARVIQDIARLIVPSAETLANRGVRQLERLIENVNERWIRSIPLVDGPLPQPDYSVGLRSIAFPPEQLKKLQSLTGNWKTSSRLMATDSMYFPLLTCEVKCGNEALNIADRQNVHIVSVAAKGMIELYQAVNRE